ncbi:MAG: hypothetical protein HY820_25505 [Acidobacteria bacterium]|nr:hypothetical protein [Acidobacteriota bacterium]
MELDQFKSVWQSQDPGPEQRLRERVAATGRVIVTRDRVEISAVVVLILIFAVMFWLVRAPLARFGALWTIGASIHVGARLYLTRRRTPPLDPSLPVREYCEREISRVQDQIRLLQTAGVWYVLPLLTGAFLTFAGLSGWNRRTAWYAAGLVVLGILITLFNLYAARTQLEPLAARLRQLRDSLS